MKQMKIQVLNLKKLKTLSTNRIFLPRMPTLLMLRI
jgi:hypothetical protein